ncbi:LysR substrate-binding domain-containing protein [Pseudomonas silvicola]|nr:LysR substrate-binding domain-containing protein [Pseudomonas silvicola]
MRADTPLKAVACFDAVMRAGSLVEAARHLYLTPGAVGQQIRKLEAWLGTPLFIRSVRHLQPTAAAKRYWEQVRPALEQLDNTHAQLLATDNSVRLTFPPAFATTWFARRMPYLTRQHPQLSLHLNASTEQVDLEHAPFDLAVRHFDGKASNVAAALLLSDEVRVYASPSYLASLGASGLRAATLLSTTSHAYWPRWLALSGQSSAVRGSTLQFDQSELAIDAARRNQGLVLTSPWLVEDDVEQHRLVQVFEPALATGKGYYLVQSQNIASDGPVEIFRQWLCAQAACCSLADAPGHQTRAQD